MKKQLLKLLTLLILALLLPNVISAQQTVALGQIDILSGVSDVNFADAICQCDTIVVEYEVKPLANFASTTSFEYQLALSPALAFGAPTFLELTQLEKGDPPIALALPSDTFSSGKKWAYLVVPCNTPLGIYGLRIINRNANGTITPVDGFSDTAFYQVSRIPTIAQIDSIAMVRADSHIDTTDNPYSGTLDVGICKMDSIFLRVATNASSIQWYNGFNTMIGETKDSLLVGSPGVYYAKVTNGGLCSIYSDTVTVTAINTPTDISFNLGNPLNANAYIIDWPAINSTPDDSLELCINETAVLRGPVEPLGTGVIFDYQWLTDSLNTVTGLRDWYALPTPSATTRFLTIDQNSSVPGWNYYRLAVGDGFCEDTTAIFSQFKVWIDTVPDGVPAGIPFLGTTGPTVFGEVCMTDSVNLSLFNNGAANPLWRYQWQWYDTSVPAGANPWKSVSGQPVGSLTFDTMPTIKIDTSLSDAGQPYFQSPKPELRFFRVRVASETVNYDIETCVYFSDSIAVRWFPDYDLTVASAPGINVIGQDSINFCETDSATLSAPSTPPGLLTFGYSYSYQWVTDSIDPNNGQRVKYAITGETNQSLIVFETGRYFAVIDDGICSDTSDVYRVFVDSLPSTTIQEITFPGSTNGLTGYNLCLYDSALVSATDTMLGLAPWRYQWQQLNPTNGFWTSLLVDTLVTFQIDLDYKRVGEDTAYFRLQTSYFNQFGLETCVSLTDSIAVIFYENPTLSFIPGDSIGLCPGDSILMVATGNFNTASWDNGSILGATRYINTPGTYPISVTGINGCISLDTVTVYPLIVSASAGSDQTAESGVVVNLTAFGGTNYRWYANKPLQFSDFLSQSIQVSKVLENGVLADTITIYVEVTNQRGCIGLDSLQLIITKTFPEQVSEINKAYNLFTPNGDGLNDDWDIRELMDGDACAIQIMNRWGSVVYEEDAFNGIWTGVDNGGNALPDGTYYYILDCQPAGIRMRNAVTVIRNQQ
jgi:gliding motility-associated-like protein